MPGTAVCTICRDVKSEDLGLVAARERYRCSHVAQVDKYAERQGMPFYVLSGVYGFIPADELVPLYDHVLVADEVSVLTLMVYRQLRELKLEAVHFYKGAEQDWEPYHNALKFAADSLGIGFHVLDKLSEGD